MHRLKSLSLMTGTVLPAFAWAHGDSAQHHWWTLDPWVWAPMAIVCILYARGMTALGRKRHVAAAGAPIAAISFALGMGAVFLALIWPLDALSGSSFAAHMAQHMLLIAVAAPLLVLADPAMPLMLGVPRRWRRPLTSVRAWLSLRLRIFLLPGVAFSIHAAFIWLWHAPSLYEMALHMEWLHVVEHVTFFGSALLFWTSIAHVGRRGGQDHGAAALWCLLTLIHTGMLGALLTFAPRLMYVSYVDADSPLLTPLEDQQLAGLLMWIPAGLCYLGAGLGFAASWLRQAQCRESENRTDFSSIPVEPWQGMPVDIIDSLKTSQGAASGSLIGKINNEQERKV